MNFAQRIIDSVDEEKIINQVVSKVMDNLDLDSLVKELHQKLVYALIDKITRELSHAVDPVRVKEE